ncbi:MAG: glycosyltransferase family 4 protein [Roseibacillus sp.]
MENLYATADLCLVPSRVEPLGNVVLESWSFDLPIVAAASEGPSWLIDNGENGLLIPIDDADAGAAAVRKLLEDQPLAQRLVAGGRAKLEAKFSRDGIVKEYEDLFGRLVQ